MVEIFTPPKVLRQHPPNAYKPQPRSNKLTHASVKKAHALWGPKPCAPKHGGHLHIEVGAGLRAQIVKNRCVGSTGAISPRVYPSLAPRRTLVCTISRSSVVNTSLITGAPCGSSLAITLSVGPLGRQRHLGADVVTEGRGSRPTGTRRWARSSRAGCARSTARPAVPLLPK